MSRAPGRTVARDAARRRGRRARRPAFALAAASALAAPGAGAVELVDLFGAALACPLVRPLLADTVPAPAFARTADGCAPLVPGSDADPAGGRGAYFADAACTVPFPFAPTGFDAWCATLLAPAGIGEGGGIEPAWTSSPGSRLDVGARGLDGVVQPYLRREVFREIETAAGTCTLEMRVHAPRPVGEGVPTDPGPSLIAWHGGSWSDRGFGTFGLEVTVPHFVERGFTVYAPFYRLLGSGDGEGGGSDACAGADFESGVVVDAHAALDWVLDNDVRFGSDGPPVLFGQSAGGQLAARVAADRPGEVSATVAFYAPVDFADFAARASSGAYTDQQGLGILERVLGVPAGAADLDASPIPENSLPERVVRDGIELPPTFLLQGRADTLVEARQAVRLCEALAGEPLTPADVELDAPTAARTIRACGEGSTLHLVRDGRHALDVCVAAVPFVDGACLSGGPDGRALVADSIGAAAAFALVAAGASDDVFFPDDEPPAAGGGSSGGGPLGPLGAAGLVAALLGARRGAQATAARRASRPVAS